MKSNAKSRGNQQATCNVNSMFNYTVGVIAVSVAAALGYLLYMYSLR